VTTAVASLRSLLRGIRENTRAIASLPALLELREQAIYLSREVSRLQALARRNDWRARRRNTHQEQTKASFDFQWDRMPAGASLPTDQSFMTAARHEVPAMVGVAPHWFEGKRVIDVGCGLGRYSHALLTLGSVLTSCDQSEAALRRTAQLCDEFAGRLTLKRVDLLEWNESADYDLAFCYGVVHHTGNTYLAIENVCRKVRPGGRVFFMIYAVPTSVEGLREINLYERLADEIREMSFEQRKAFVERRFGPDKAHGWFDAISPRINDRLSYEEIHDLLAELGFVNIAGRIVMRNHYITAERSAASN
jgi:2-polyprenyl-3-methyl-5-hydroxy-6-metoxy-1,4-benzoquinol methylase